MLRHTILPVAREHRFLDDQSPVVERVAARQISSNGCPFDDLPPTAIMNLVVAHAIRSPRA